MRTILDSRVVESLEGVKGMPRIAPGSEVKSIQMVEGAL